MLQRVVAAALLSAFVCIAGVPAPKEHFGYDPGDDFKLANYGEIIAYFQQLEKSSDRIRLVEYGKTSEGRSSWIAFISSPENLKRLDEFKEVSRKLALGQATPSEAADLAKRGKAIVWIDSGLHATEVAPAQHSPHLAYKMLTDESEEVRAIRDNVILLQVPVINPDGLDMVSDWYRKNVGTPYELAPLPMLYQKYAGHDNNRDWFMMNLPETRNVSRLLFQEWFPQVVYNQHQAPAFPARIFVPPYAEPLNPNIPAAVMEGINSIGGVIKERFARENKPGILSYWGYDAWWNGGLRSAPAFHNMHGILTEVAGHVYATPRVYDANQFPERFGNGLPTKLPSVFYQRPWMGGKWGLRDAIDYMMTVDFAILDLTVKQRESLLHKAWEVARTNIELGKTSAYIIPEKGNALAMISRLQQGGIQAARARRAFQAGDKSYPASTWIIPAEQAFRAYLVDLMEPHQYPEIKTGISGPTKRPYDVAGWTLPMLMGVAVERVDKPFDVDAESMQAQPAPWPQRKSPRVAIYEPWQPNSDAGWTEWTFDNAGVPYTVVRGGDFRSGELSRRFDTVVLPSQSMAAILHGYRPDESIRRTGITGESAGLQRPEYTGGIGIAGAAALEEFVRQGGTLIAFDDATALPVELFGLPLRPLIRPGAEDSYFCPGSILRMTANTTHPIAKDTPAEFYAFSDGGQAWDVTLLPEKNTGDQEVKVIARYASKNVLASGWLTGERTVAGHASLVEARHGKGRVILFGFRPQFRGQTWGTFSLLFNAL